MNHPAPLRVCHVIANMDGVGGAQAMMQKLLQGLDRSNVESEVVALMRVGSFGERIAKLDIPVTALGMRHGLHMPRTVMRLKQHLQRRRPDVVQTWMYHADLVGTLAARLAGGIPVVWNIRHAHLCPQTDKRLTHWIAAACARISRRGPATIIVNSKAGLTSHGELGYDTSRMVVLPNGFDTTAFRPSAEARRAMRQELGLPADRVLMGIVGRYHPVKDHASFIAAAGIVAKQFPNLDFVLCGTDVVASNASLMADVNTTGCADRFHLLGPRSDMPAVQASLDLAVLCSRSEGFPNVVGEAMSCGVPCVVTDVGDAAVIVGDTSGVVPVADPTALAEACRRILALSPEARQELGQRARARIETNFDLRRIVGQYESLWRAAAKCTNHTAPAVRRAA